MSCMARRCVSWLQVVVARARNLNNVPMQREVLEIDNERPLRPTLDRQLPNNLNRTGSTSESGGGGDALPRPSMRQAPSSAASSWEQVRRDGAAAALTAAAGSSSALAHRVHAPASSRHMAAAVTGPPAPAAPGFHLPSRPPPPQPPPASRQAPFFVGSAVAGRSNVHLVPGPEEGSSRGRLRPQAHPFAAFGGSSSATGPFTSMNLGSSR